MQGEISDFPIWAIIIDYVLGMIMWTLVGRAAMGIFLREDSTFFFSRIFIKLTDPILKIFSPITPAFLVNLIVPLYVAWFFFMLRFYVMPPLLGYSVFGMLSFPLEGEIASSIYSLLNK